LRLNFCTDRVNIRFVLKHTKWGVLYENWHFWPLEIDGVGDKHPHDSDHAECTFDYVVT